MDAILAAIRPKQNVSGHDYRAKSYDILLLDHRDKTADKQGKPTKYLPAFPLNADEEPREEVLTHLYKLTGGEHGGVKGERALVIDWNKKEGYRDSLSRFSMFCIPISARDTLNSGFVDKSPHSPGFFSLDVLIHWLNNSSMSFPPPTRTFVMHLENWLKEKHSIPGALNSLFRSKADYRIRLSVNNPAFLSSSGGHGSEKPGALRSDIPDEIRYTANETLAKMMSIEKCDKVVINPLFGSNHPLRSKPIARWHLDQPDYPVDDSNYSSRKSSINSAFEPDIDQGREQYPLHVHAAKGDVRRLEEMIARGHPHSSRDLDRWAPIHWAAWGGHAEAVQLLLKSGCSPNVVNGKEKTPLHMAADKGFSDVVEVLLSHPETDINSLDKKGRTALEVCEQHDRTWPHENVRKLLILASQQPRQIQVLVMDGTKKNLNLLSGANTSVQQLNQQMLREYNMPETPYADIFTIWICSQNLELQLKPEHKPLEHMNSWKERIVKMLTDGDPSKEDPQLTWRRNAKISLLEEREAVHPDAIKLLFYEARQNYIRALYPCKEQDVLLFASILLYMNHGEYNPSTAKVLVSSTLQQLVPAPNLKSRHNWSQRIVAQYKEFSTQISALIGERPEMRFRLQQTLQLRFLNNCRNLTVYGSAFFTGSLQPGNSKAPVKCSIGVNDVGIHIINSQTRTMLHSYKYEEILWRVLNTDLEVLEIKIVRKETRSSEKNSPRNPLEIRTRQARMINHLMGNLSHIMHGLVYSRSGH